MGSNVRAPGILWVIVLMGIGALIQANTTWIVTTTGIDPIWVNAAVTFLFSVWKYADLSTDPFTAALDVIELMRARMQPKSGQQVRGPYDGRPLLVEDDIPARPNMVVRFLVG